MFLEPLFKRMARDFAQGNVAAIAARFATPSVIYIGDRALPLRSSDDLISALATYRRNLCVESYARSDVELAYQSDPINGRVQVLLHWSNRNDRGAEISSFDASYICRQGPEGAWQIVDHEILPPVKPRLTAGIALVQRGAA